jgi:ABC-type amino acid transport substrate-binding protein
MFKKHLSLIATFFLIFVLCAPADGGTLEEIMKRRKITFGVKYDFPPFGYVDDSGAVKGFDIYVANYIAGKLGVVPAQRGYRRYHCQHDKDPLQGKIRKFYQHLLCRRAGYSD